MKDEIELFCCQCFASETSGSWNHTVVGDASSNGCTNCGGNGTAFPLPRRAIESIRRQASWVGKRYYPHEEDREAREERQRLLALVTSFPGRTAEWDGAMGAWKVTQQLPGGRTVRTWTYGGTDSDTAMRTSGLPYMTEERLAETESNGRESGEGPCA